MQKGSRITQLLVVAIICFVAAQLWARRSYERERRKEQQLAAFMSESRIEAQAYNDGYPTVSTLEDLRTGNTNPAIERLESKLDMDLYDILRFYKQHPEAKVDPHELELLAKIREYRLRYPRDTRSPSIDQPVAEILSWTNIPASK